MIGVSISCLLLTVALVAGGLLVHLRRRRACQTRRFHDAEWGLIATADFMLGKSPVLVFPEGSEHPPGTARPSHIVEMGAVLVCASADPALEPRPPEGWICYVDERQTPIVGGLVQITNLPALRDVVFDLLHLIRSVMRTGEEPHRHHESGALCGRCPVRGQCAERLPPEDTRPRTDV